MNTQQFNELNNYLGYFAGDIPSSEASKVAEVISEVKGRLDDIYFSVGLDGYTGERFYQIVKSIAADLQIEFYFVYNIFVVEFPSYEARLVEYMTKTED